MHVLAREHDRLDDFFDVIGSGSAEGVVGEAYSHDVT